MEIKIRKAEDRGTAEHGWLHAKFSFSFADYYDPAHCGFHALQVMNNDVIEPQSGFPMHPHQNAEIFTYIMNGQLEHKDSMGNGSIIQKGELQCMSAGSGIYHSETNPSAKESTELYQIWMKPAEEGGEPRYAEKKGIEQSSCNGLKLLFSENGKGDSTPIRQKAEFYMGHLSTGEKLSIEPQSCLPHGWVQIIQGSLSLEGQSLSKGDGLSFENQNRSLSISAGEETKFFFFRLR